MKLKAVSGMMLTLLLIGMLTLAFNIQPVKAGGLIFIRSDGSVDPSTAPIQRDGNVYTFTDNIYDSSGVRVQKDDVIVDGNGYTLQGTGDLRGFDLGDAVNTTVKNVVITQFEDGVYLSTVSGYTLIGNTITNNLRDGIFMYFSENNAISYNTISNNGRYGINVGQQSTGNVIIGNTIENNVGNGLVIFYSSGNTIYHNNIINNTYNVVFYGETTNVWDDGYPSGGNYWSDYSGVDVKSGPNQDQPSSDGIGDTAYVIDASNIDNYPLMYPWGAPPPPSYTLTISSSPAGVTFTVDGVSRTTPLLFPLWSGTYNEGASVTLEMPETHDGYVWDHWLSYVIDDAHLADVEPQGTWSNMTCPNDGSQLTRIVIFYYPECYDCPWRFAYYCEIENIFWIADFPGGIADMSWYGPFENRDTNRIKTVTMNTDITLTGVYGLPGPVGGKATPINIQINKPETPVLWIWLTTIILPLVATVIFMKLKKKKQ